MANDLSAWLTHPGLPPPHRIRAPRSGQLEGAPCLLLLHGAGANEMGLADIAAQLDPRLTVILVRSPNQREDAARLRSMDVEGTGSRDYKQMNGADYLFRQNRPRAGKPN